LFVAEVTHSAFSHCSLIKPSGSICQLVVKPIDRDRYTREPIMFSWSSGQSTNSTFYRLAFLICMVPHPYSTFKSAQPTLALPADINCALSTGRHQPTPNRFQAIAHAKQHCATHLLHSLACWLCLAPLYVLRHQRHSAPYVRRRPLVPSEPPTRAREHLHACHSLLHVCAHILNAF
jgi:hypothetical protein